MDKISVVIVEDEFAIAEDIRSRLEHGGYRVRAVFDRGETALAYLLKEVPDILLVDIHLAGAMDGVDLVGQVNEAIQIPVIYITANSDSATYERARQTRPHSFLVKPFSSANLLASVDLALLNFSNEKIVESIERPLAQESGMEAQFLVNQCLFIRTQGKYKKVSCDDLLFIEAAGSYVHIQTKIERYTLSHNLTHFQKRTPLPNLIRIHRSYIVNLTKIDSFEESYVFIQNHKLPLSDNYKSDFLAKIHCL
jgi:DNA-binding LytR/AlgR family response regulator